MSAAEDTWMDVSDRCLSLLLCEVSHELGVNVA